ncbi:signal peptidase I [Gordonia phosphorivorans]|uniref:Signal peptidase I n=1 Tax=Gordonia phosphorivorans TaxID=1056982 RepID=A0ABV6HBU7_9ACTN
MSSQHIAATAPRRSRRELALNVGAVAGLLCLVVAVASMIFGITPLVFRSGSMAPQITTGSLALARTVPAADLRVGDVVSVENDSGTRITHRVIAVEPAGEGAVSLTLKGDANPIADGSPYVVTEADRVITSVPGLGYVAAWLSSRTAIFLGGVLAGALLMLAFGPLRRPGTDEPETAAPLGAPHSETDQPADGEAQLQEAHRG